MLHVAVFVSPSVHTAKSSRRQRHVILFGLSNPSSRSGISILSRTATTVRLDSTNEHTCGLATAGETLDEALMRRQFGETDFPTTIMK